MSYVNLNGHNVYYEVQGEGPTIILLHGAIGSTRDWRYFMPKLVEAGYQAIAYDRIGFGRSDPLPHWSLNYLHRDRDDLVALMDALEIESTALVGSGDGATISLLTSAIPNRHTMLVVAESPHMWYEQESVAQGFQYFYEVLEQDARFIKAMRQAHGNRANEVIQRWKERWLDPAFFGWNENKALDNVSGPVFIIHAQRSILFSGSHSKEIARTIQDIMTWYWPNAGYTPHLEQPEEYAQGVISFIDLIRYEYDYVYNPSRPRGKKRSIPSW